MEFGPRRVRSTLKAVSLSTHRDRDHVVNGIIIFCAGFRILGFTSERKIKTRSVSAEGK